MKTAIALLMISAVCACAQSPVLTISDSQGYHWEAAAGQNAAQLYPASGQANQAFTWTPTGSTVHFTVCTGTTCLSDNLTGSVVLSTKADLFTITSTGAVQDVSTGRYVGQPTPTAGSFLIMGTEATAWKFALTQTFSPGAGTSLSVMPMGDSITEGFPTSATLAQGGYRCPLWSLLSQKSIAVQTSGNGINNGTTNGPISCTQSKWEGHYGYTIQQIESMEVADGAVAKAKPSIILLLAGTNDVAQGLTGGISEHLSALLESLFAQDGNAHVFLSTIPPMNPAENSGVAAWATQVPYANEQIRAVAAEFGSRVTLVDNAANMTPSMIQDGVHPNLQGYAVIASGWANAIEAYEK